MKGDCEEGGGGEGGDMFVKGWGVGYFGDGGHVGRKGKNMQDSTMKLWKSQG